MKDIKQILHQIRPEADYSISSNFIEDSLLDSLDMIRLVSELDKAFSVSIAGEDIIPENFENLAAIKKLVENYSTKK